MDILTFVGSLTEICKWSGLLPCGRKANRSDRSIFAKQLMSCFFVVKHDWVTIPVTRLTRPVRIPSLNLTTCCLRGRSRIDCQTSLPSPNQDYLSIRCSFTLRLSGTLLPSTSNTSHPRAPKKPTPQAPHRSPPRFGLQPSAVTAPVPARNRRIGLNEMFLSCVLLYQ